MAVRIRDDLKTCDVENPACRSDLLAGGPIWRPDPFSSWALSGLGIARPSCRRVHHQCRWCGRQCRVHRSADRCRRRPSDVLPEHQAAQIVLVAALGRALAAHIASYDVAHLHSVFLWPTWAAARRARSMNVPYLISPRGMLVPELIRRKSRWAKSAWIALIERRNLMATSAIHVTSEVEARSIASFGWRLPPVVVIPNGVDDPVDFSGVPLSPDIHAAIAGGGFVLALGRINWEKGLDRLIACLPLAPQARLIIAGDDDEGQATLLAREAKRVGVADRVTILARHVDGADKEALFAAAQLVAMPSLSENFGLVAVEAMRRGLPVLVTPEVGMAQIVRDAGGGVVVEGKIGAIAHGLESLLRDPQGARAMGVAGRAHVIAHYGWESIAERMEALYATLLELRRPIVDA